MSLIPPPFIYSLPPIDFRPAHVSYVPQVPSDVLWNRPVFRPPSLPTPAQIWSELPFTVHTVVKVSKRK